MGHWSWRKREFFGGLRFSEYKEASLGYHVGISEAGGESFKYEGMNNQQL